MDIEDPKVFQKEKGSSMEEEDIWSLCGKPGADKKPHPIRWPEEIKMKCIMCKKDKPDNRRRRQNTAYVDDERNFVILCDECNKINEEYWEEMWEDFYSVVL